LTGLWPEGCGIARRAMSFISRLSAVTSTSSIIIGITTVHPFATSWPSSPKGDARTLRDWLSVSYGMIRILVIGSLRSPPKGKTPKWYVKYMTRCFSPQIPRFPLRGNASKRQKGVRGRAPVGCSIAVLTANRRPVSFLLLTLGHTFSVKVQRVQRGRFLRWTGPMGRRVLKFDGLSGRGLWIAALRQCL